jgi:hypothetical protein
MMVLLCCGFCTIFFDFVVVIRRCDIKILLYYYYYYYYSVLLNYGAQSVSSSHHISAAWICSKNFPTKFHTNLEYYIVAFIREFEPPAAGPPVASG